VGFGSFLFWRWLRGGLVHMEQGEA